VPARLETAATARPDPPLAGLRFGPHCVFTRRPQNRLGRRLADHCRALVSRCPSGLVLQPVLLLFTVDPTALRPISTSSPGPPPHPCWVGLLASRPWPVSNANPLFKWDVLLTADSLPIGLSAWNSLRGPSVCPNQTPQPGLTVPARSWVGWKKSALPPSAQFLLTCPGSGRDVPFHVVRSADQFSFCAPLNS